MGGAPSEDASFVGTSVEPMSRHAELSVARESRALRRSDSIIMPPSAGSF
jgi:hypothetical protein